jgi:hypothetical protein
MRTIFNRHHRLLPNTTHRRCARATALVCLLVGAALLTGCSAAKHRHWQYLAQHRVEPMGPAEIAALEPWDDAPITTVVLAGTSDTPSMR